MHKERITEPATAEWASIAVIVPMQDRSHRMCIDYCKLNAVNSRDMYPLPRIDKCNDSLRDAVVFFTLDASWGYRQMPVTHEDKDKTTFSSHARAYRFNRMPIGLKNAPATFQSALGITIMKCTWKFDLTYLDDIIIFFKAHDHHLQDLENVL